MFAAQSPGRASPFSARRRTQPSCRLLATCSALGRLNGTDGSAVGPAFGNARRNPCLDLFKNPAGGSGRQPDLRREASLLDQSVDRGSRQAGDFAYVCDAQYFGLTRHYLYSLDYELGLGANSVAGMEHGGWLGGRPEQIARVFCLSLSGPTTESQLSGRISRQRRLYSHPLLPTYHQNSFAQHP